ncbi:MAG: gliding motility-associated ABC transporter permease subunit GldF [Cyclobacteriaceae bacterium]|nr:gliding motility-associated ABC transporter permease subunit GldF [Cyclobacteriaceae bacterium]
MIQILVKEFNGFLDSLIAYIVIGVFLTVVGLMMWVFPETSVLEYGYAEMNTLFSFAPFVFMFLIPAITMRMFAEEKKSGTLEFLFTHPLTDWQIVLGKFFSSWLLVVVAIMPTIIYYFTLSEISSPAGNIDTPGIIGSYIGLFLLGGVFTSIGILASSITSNQIVAFVIAVFLCFILYSGIDSLSVLMDSSSTQVLLEELSVIHHYNAMSRGVIDSRNVVYFGSVIVLMLSITKIVLGSRKW